MTTMMGVSLVLLAACCSVLSLAPHQDPHGPRFGPFPSLLPTGRAIRPLPHRLTPEEQARLHPHRLRQPHFIPSEMEPYHQHDGHATPEAAAKPSEPFKLPPRRQDVPIEPFAEPRQQPETVGAAWLVPRNPQQMLPHPVYPVHQLRKREAAADLSLVPSEMDAYHQHREGLDIGVRPVQLQHGDEEDFPFWSQPQVPRPVPVMPLPALPEQPVNPHQRSAEFAVRPASLVPRNPQHILPHPVYPVHQLRKREAGDLSLVPSEMDAYHQHREGSQVAVRPVHLQHGDEEDFWQQSRGPRPVMPLPQAG